MFDRKQIGFRFSILSLPHNSCFLYHSLPSLHLYDWFFLFFSLSTSHVNYSLTHFMGNTAKWGTQRTKLIKTDNKSPVWLRGNGVYHHFKTLCTLTIYVGLWNIAFSISLVLIHNIPMRLLYTVWRSIHFHNSKLFKFTQALCLCDSIRLFQ